MDASSGSSGSSGSGSSSSGSSDELLAASSSALSATSSTSLRLGTVLDGRYRLERLLGEGGMGTVYRAHHLSMDRAVAVKVLRGSLARDPIASRRFALEAKTTTKVDSPNAVKVFDFGITAEGEYFMVMEYLDGRTAQRELDIDGPMAMPRALHVARQALEGLAAAHAVGVIHRDVKPENLLLMRVGSDPDFCKVLDFGVAKLMVQAADPATALTREGMVFGTPEFMSPEQACGQPLDGRSDLYSLAATLYTLLTGEALFHGSSAVEVLSKHVTKPPPRLVDRRGLHHLHALDQVLQRALAKRPADRFRDAAELARALAFLAPASAPQSAAGTPTVSTPALPSAPGRNATPDSPLGVLPSRSPLGGGLGGGLSDAPTGASPLFSEASGAQPLLGEPRPEAPSADAPWAAASGPWAASQPARPALPLLSDHGATGVAMPTGFRPAMTGYLPRVSMELEPSLSTQARRPASAAAGGRRRRLVVAGAVALAAGLAVAGWQLTAGGPARPDPGQIARAEPSLPGRDPGGDTKAPDRRVDVVAPAADAALPALASAPDAPDAASAPTTPDAASASPSPDAASAPTTPPPPTRPGRDPGAEPRQIREYLTQARQAKAERRSLAQLTYANKILELAPRHREALLLLADAQLKYNDTGQACKTLAKLRGSATAAKLAAEAGCP